MSIRSSKEARIHAKDKRPTIEYGPAKRTFKSDSLIFQYIFDLQVRIEKKGPMDYRRYAETMWRELVGDPRESPHEFLHFENSMIQRLHDIDVPKYLYPAAKQSLNELVRTYFKNVRHVAIWSTGDVEATGYQAAKISDSKVIDAFYRSVVKQGEKDSIREKTSYLVDGDKFARLVEYVDAHITAHPEENMKLVIIEDSQANFDKAAKAIHARLGPSEEKIQIIPIWAAYSRKGLQAKAKAEREGTLGAYAANFAVLNGINSFRDLLNAERFGPLLKDAHVFVDFDGVISDNVKMRELQAQAIGGSLIESIGGAEHGSSVSRRISRRIARQFPNL